MTIANSVSIDAVPESISREDYVWMLAAVGLNPCDLTEVRFSTKGVYATVFARDAEGRRILDRVDGEDRIAKHEVFIPVTD